MPFIVSCSNCGFKAAGIRDDVASVMKRGIELASKIGCNVCDTQIEINDITKDVYFKLRRDVGACCDDFVVEGPTLRCMKCGMKTERKVFGLRRCPVCKKWYRWKTLARHNYG